MDSVFAFPVTGGFTIFPIELSIPTTIIATEQVTLFDDGGIVSIRCTRQKRRDPWLVKLHLQVVELVDQVMVDKQFPAASDVDCILRGSGRKEKEKQGNPSHRDGE